MPPAGDGVPVRSASSTSTVATRCSPLNWPSAAICNGMPCESGAASCILNEARQRGVGRGETLPRPLHRKRQSSAGVAAVKLASAGAARSSSAARRREAESRHDLARRAGHAVTLQHQRARAHDERRLAAVEASGRASWPPARAQLGRMRGERGQVPASGAGTSALVGDAAWTRQRACLPSIHGRDDHCASAGGFPSSARSDEAS